MDPFFMTQRHWIQNGQMMFVTTNVADKQPVFADAAKARIAVGSIYETQVHFPFYLFAFVVMPDHCHWMLSVPEEGSVSKIMHRYKRAVSFQLGKGPMWQPRFDCRIVRKCSDVIEYIHQNPVKAELSATPEEYLWSSASGKWDVMELD